MSRRASWLRQATRLIAAAERAVDRVRYADAEGGEARIVSYRSYGTASALRVAGRVIRNPVHRPASPADSPWQNLRWMYRRFASDEVPGARVRVEYGSESRVVAADEEGFFVETIRPRTPPPSDRSWHQVRLELLAPSPRGGVASVVAPVLIPQSTASFGVLSDLDDTVLRTEATNLLRMARTTALGSAHTRLPFEGVAAFYRALHGGASGTAANPLFYVSSSPWNLYDLLEEFLALHAVPPGPLLLRDWGLTSTELFPTRHGAHKLEAIREIFATYPHLRFILIGDSGQEDPEIYARVVDDYPGRVLAVYIRSVRRAPTRVAAIRTLAREVEKVGIALVLADDTIGAARHAAENGWIAPASLPEIGAAVAVDETRREPGESSPGAVDRER